MAREQPIRRWLSGNRAAALQETNDQLSNHERIGTSALRQGYEQAWSRFALRNWTDTAHRRFSCEQVNGYSRSPAASSARRSSR